MQFSEEVTVSRDELTIGQLSKLETWETQGKPGKVIKLGYSCGSRGNNNFHSTWAYKRGPIVRIQGDSRNAWRMMVGCFGMGHVR